jgi:hypothetical protein
VAPQGRAHDGVGPQEGPLARAGFYQGPGEPDPEVADPGALQAVEQRPCHAEPELVLQHHVVDVHAVRAVGRDDRVGGGSLGRRRGQRRRCQDDRARSRRRQGSHGRGAGCGVPLLRMYQTHVRHAKTTRLGRLGIRRGTLAVPGAPYETDRHPLHASQGNFGFLQHGNGARRVPWTYRETLARAGEPGGPAPGSLSPPDHPTAVHPTAASDPPVAPSTLDRGRVRPGRALNARLLKTHAGLCRTAVRNRPGVGVRIRWNPHRNATSIARSRLLSRAPTTRAPALAA